ncbi:unknown [Bacteroides sp. CAG:598]|nr:unknown [Bacteroides sp. CAG:598]
MKNEECPPCGQMKNFSIAQEKFFIRHILNSSFLILHF